MKDIPVNTNYQIDEFGNVYSKKRNIFLRKRLKKKKYYSVSLNGKEWSIHRLVATTYIPNLHNKKEVNHIDGVTTNNHISNLEWCTRKENYDHACRLNLKAGFQINHNFSPVKCSIDKCIEIRLLKKSGMSMYKIHKIFTKNISIGTVRNICIESYKCSQGVGYRI